MTHIYPHIQSANAVHLWCWNVLNSENVERLAHEIHGNELWTYKYKEIIRDYDGHAWSALLLYHLPVEEAARLVQYCLNWYASQNKPDASSTDDWNLTPLSQSDTFHILDEIHSLEINPSLYLFFRDFNVCSINQRFDHELKGHYLALWDGDDARFLLYTKHFSMCEHLQITDPDGQLVYIFKLSL